MKTRILYLSSLALVGAVVLNGCATPMAKPAFYPNAHYQSVGPARAEADAQACASLAQQSDVGAVNKMDAAHAGAAGSLANTWVHKPLDVINNTEITKRKNRFITRSLKNKW